MLAVRCKVNSTHIVVVCREHELLVQPQSARLVVTNVASEVDDVLAVRAEKEGGEFFLMADQVVDRHPGHINAIDRERRIRRTDAGNECVVRAVGTKRELPGIACTRGSQDLSVDDLVIFPTVTGAVGNPRAPAENRR